MRPTAEDFSRALADCLSAEARLDLVGEATEDDEESAAAMADGEARERMIGLLRRLRPGPCTPVAVSLRDGTVITYTPEGDGLCICPPEHAHRIGDSA